MPELPEVETIRIGLQQKLVGKSIKDIEILNTKTLQGNPEFVINKKILKVWRKAKILGIDLETNQTIIFHLKMSGQLIFDDGSRFVGGHPTADMILKMPNKSTRVIFEFNDHSKLYFNDQRKFGWIKILENGSKEMSDLLIKLGPEPIEPGFTWQILKSRIQSHKSLPIKVALLDQQSISGIGNIYASEACFNAKIDPRTKVSELTNQQYKNLNKGIIKALSDGIKYGGATRAHFVNSNGDKGYFLDYAFVYGRNSQLCKICGHLIKKVQLSGRGTYFCEHCQK